MDQNTLIIIVILILLSSQLWSILWDIGKSSIYITILILILSYVNPAIADNVKNIIKRMINLDVSLLKEGYSSLSEMLLSFFKKIPNIVKVKPETKPINKL
jgi:hypothetical protein